MDFIIPPRLAADDESLASLVRRRLGQEALDKIAGPLMAGIHVADPEKLSVESTFPAFANLERQHGSLLRGMIAQKRARAKCPPANSAHLKFLSFTQGMQDLPDAIAARLHASAILLGRSVLGVRSTRNGYHVVLRNCAPIRADAIIFATPAFVTADLVEQIDPGLAARLRAIRYVSSATVSLGFKREDVPHNLDGSGFLIPNAEGRQIMACSWSSVKFMHRAPAGFVLLRVFIGGSRSSQALNQSEDGLVRVALHELREIMHIAAPPVLAKSYRWDGANPQYDVGHKRRIADIEELAASHHALYLAGAAYHGPGIPDCIESGTTAARRALASTSGQTDHIGRFAACVAEGTSS